MSRRARAALDAAPRAPGRAALRTAAGGLVALVALTGCRFGQAGFESTVDGVGFEPGGTVFAYLDQRDDNLVEDPDPRVVVAMTWIVFDPERDVSDHDGGTLAAMAHELRLRDALALVFDRQGALDPGATFTATLNGNQVVASDGVDVRLHLQPERLDTGSTYADFAPLASERVVSVTLDEVGFGGEAAELTGSVEITFNAIEGRDPGAARKGSFSGTFRAPVIGERVAEKNLGLLDVHGVLGLPLGPRSTP